MRILGPNCLGLLIPRLGLNASISHIAALPGNIGFISQSGALATAVLDWAHFRGIGFSHFVSLGDAADIDFGEVLDYLAMDPCTQSVLMYIESVRNPRNFMSAARAAARTKLVLVIKAGRAEEGARAATTHTGALAGSDVVFDAAIRRAGMLRVYDFHELFAAVETLARLSPMKGDRLAIMTNGGGPGVLAVDALVDHGGRMAQLSVETVEKLSEVLPSTWSQANPVDIIGDAPGSRYADALNILIKAPEVDAILIMHAPTGISSSTEVASAIIKTMKEQGSYTTKFVLTNWLGENAVLKARNLFAEANLPSYRTPEGAVRAFMHVIRYRRNQEMLMETPPSAPSEFTPATSTARLVIENAIAAGNLVLSELEAKAVLAAYGIPTVETRMVKNPEAAGKVASQIGFPVAIKIVSPDITHKSDVRGVILDLDKPEAVIAAAEAMLIRVKELRPDAHILGFTVQKMASRKGHELIVGMTVDPVFGPAILFGEGGIAVEVIADRAVALPPFNMSLARELMLRTRIYKLLKGYRGEPAVNLDAVCLTLMQVAQLIIDLPEIIELDINPLYANEDGVLVLDARMRIEVATTSGTERLAIRPYPKELEEYATTKSGRRIQLRPIRPEDEKAHYTFLSKLAPEDTYTRFFRMIGEMPHCEMARHTQIDYDREMAFVAVAPDAEGTPETLGVVETFTNPDNSEAEFAIVVRSDLKGQGLGRILMQKMIGYCRNRGTATIIGDILDDNKRMLNFVKSLGFEPFSCPEEGMVRVRLVL